MATPMKHAKCSASSSGRWLNCTAAPNFEEQFPKGTSIYAEEGRLAHSICEATALYNADQITKRTYNSRLKKLQANENYNPEMMTTAKAYADFIWQQVMSFKEKPYQAQEVRVDFSEYVPEGFGTSDCVIIGDGTLVIVDYKHGKGVPVSAENNSQMRLYALGALDQYGMLYVVEKVRMCIVQPRITDEVSIEELTVDQLKAWGEQIKPIAQKAFTGEGAEFKEGPWCRFCAGKAVCRARAENMTALEDFRDLPIEGKLSEEDAALRSLRMDAGEVLPPVLTDADIGELLHRGAELVSWYNDLKDYALSAILDGKEIPGWKAVEGRSVRSFDDAEAAFKDIIAAGYEETMLYERKPKSLAEVEKMLGKKAFAEVAGAHVMRPPGKPALAEESDKRPSFSPAATDFAGVT